MQIWAESGKSALPICNYSQILYQFLTFTQNLKRSQKLRMYKWRGCRTSKYFLLGGSPAFKYSVLYVPRTAYKDQA